MFESKSVVGSQGVVLGGGPRAAEVGERFSLKGCDIDQGEE